MIVVDTSVIAYLYLTSERSVQAEQVFLRDPAWAVPILWRSEFCSVLTGYVRKGHLLLEDAINIMHQAELLVRDNEHLVASENVLQLASTSPCSAYDCEFVALAAELGAPLVTADRLIIRSFPGLSVSLDAYARSEDG